MVAVSWQHTPAGFQIVGEGLDARAEITDFWAMVFNPSSMVRVLHVWIGALLAGAFMVLSVHAWYLIKGRHTEISKMAFKAALIVAAFFSLGQLFAGHLSSMNVYEHQPAKMATFEGHFEESAPGDMYLLGIVDKENQEVKGIKIPGGLSFLLTFDFKAPVTGLNAFPEEDRPSAVNAVFQFYHIMIVLGLAMIALTLFALYMWVERKTIRQTMAATAVCPGSLFTPDIKPGRVVCYRNGTSTLGCLWDTQNFRCIFTYCNQGTACFFTGAFLCCVYHLVYSFYLPAD